MTLSTISCICWQLACILLRAVPLCLVVLKMKNFQILKEMSSSPCFSLKGPSLLGECLALYWMFFKIITSWFSSQSGTQYGGEDRGRSGCWNELENIVERSGGRAGEQEREKSRPSKARLCHQLFLQKMSQACAVWLWGRITFLHGHKGT